MKLICYRYFNTVIIMMIIVRKYVFIKRTSSVKHTHTHTINIGNVYQKICGLLLTAAVNPRLVLGSVVSGYLYRGGRSGLQSFKNLFNTLTQSTATCKRNTIFIDMDTLVQLTIWGKYLFGRLFV